MLRDSGISELACQMQAEKGLNLKEKYNIQEEQQHVAIK